MNTPPVKPTPFNVDQVARAVEADAGHALPGLRQSLREANAGLGRVTDAQTIERRRAGRPPLAEHKAPVTLRMAPDALARWRASGKGWQTRAAALLAAIDPQAAPTSSAALRKAVDAALGHERR